MRTVVVTLLAGLVCVVVGCSGPAAKLPDSAVKKEATDLPSNEGGLPKKGGTGTGGK